MYSPAASPSPSAHTSTSSEDSEGWRDHRQVQAMYRSQLSVAVVGPLGPTLGEVPAQSAGEMVLASCSRSGMALGVVHPIPMGSRVAQVDMTLEYFAEATGRARGPLTLEWCQAVALCASCTQQGEQCEFKEPMPGCSVTLSWRAACIVAEQGWDCKWVAMQLEEGQRGRVSGRGSGVEGGGWRGVAPDEDWAPMGASPLPEAGHSKQAWGELALAGPPSPTVYSPTSGTLVEPSTGGSWLIVEAFLRRQAEELERLLATCREEVCRVGEERDGF
ncbi:hypothetical protein E4T56_gene16604 [Termitomyces sp. T112]|nr:hypothetical protein E4T56_gene16604 [Termitomyces sp. T112]